METTLFFTPNIPGDDQKIFSRAEWHDILQKSQAELQTALWQICPFQPGADCYTLLLARGSVVSFYRGQRHVHRLPTSDIYEIFPENRLALNLRTLSLTPQAVRLVKILLEQPGPSQTEWAATDDLPQTIARYGQLTDAGLLQLVWDGAQALVLLPGKGKSARQTLMLGAGQVSHSIGLLTAIKTRPEKDCHLAWYDAAENGSAWQEYHLYEAFSRLVNRFLRRFDELGSQSLLHTCLRTLNFTCHANGWNITFTARHVTNQAVFASPAQAGQVYQRLLAIALQQAQATLGSATVKLLLHDGLGHLSAAQRAAIKQHLPWLQDITSW